MYLQLLQEMKNWTSHLAFQTSESSVQLILVFPSVLHLCAALMTQMQCVPNPDGHPCEVTHRAEACATVSDHFRPPNCIGLHAAHHFRSWACHTCTRPWPFELDTPAIVLALYTTPRAPRRRPARPLVPLHTPTNPAHLRRVP